MDRDPSFAKWYKLSNLDPKQVDDFVTVGDKDTKVCYKVVR